MGVLVTDVLLTNVEGASGVSVSVGMGLVGCKVKVEVTVKGHAVHSEYSNTLTVECKMVATAFLCHIYCIVTTIFHETFDV